MFVSFSFFFKLLIFFHIPLICVKSKAAVGFERWNAAWRWPVYKSGFSIWVDKECLLSLWHRRSWRVGALCDMKYQRSRTRIRTWYEDALIFSIGENDCYPQFKRRWYFLRLIVQLNWVDKYLCLNLSGSSKELGGIYGYRSCNITSPRTRYVQRVSNDPR